MALLILLFAITYIDRVCISVAGPRIQEELHIDPVGWGWITGAFSVAYMIFEIPSGTMGDRIGARLVLTRVVLWWSAFTSLTGMVSSFRLMLLVRFCFGMGEAGAFPNASIVIARWFPRHRQARIAGVILMASQIGGAIAPLLVVPVQARYGWRASFYLFGAVGVIWCAVWYWWFRDSPAQKPGISQAELEETAGQAVKGSHSLPWGVALRSSSVLSLVTIAACYVYTYVFFQTWFHTFLVKARGFSEGTLVLSALPYAVAAVANLTGGAASDELVRRIGLKWGRRSLGIVGLAGAGLLTIAVMFVEQKVLTVVILALIYGCITFQQSGVFAVCLDIGRNHAGAIVGLMNTSAQVGGLISSVAFGYLVERYNSYTVPFIPMAALLLIGALLWLKVDPTQELASHQAGR